MANETTETRVGLVVLDSENKLSLKRFLTARFPAHSVMYLASRARKGCCVVDGAIAEWGTKVRSGQRVEIELDLYAATARTPENIPLVVIYEDPEILAVDKPPGMLVHPTKHVKSGTLANAISHYLEGRRFWFPHRLDRDVSGVLAIAKTVEATNRLAKLWLSRQVTKRYLALLEGSLEIAQLDIDAPIGRNATRKPEWAIDPEGKPSLTKLEFIGQRADRSLVALYPVTGRTNQLRLHTAHIGHPIVGDTLYGAKSAERLHLHAHSLALPDLLLQSQIPAWAK